MDEKKEKKEKKKYNSGNKIGVRIMAGVLAFLMVSSVIATIASYFLI